jgi:hypothetical protein
VHIVLFCWHEESQRVTAVKAEDPLPLLLSEMLNEENHPQVEDQAPRVAVAHDDLVDVDRRDRQPGPRQQVAGVPHLQHWC